ncbi:hypothetical protein QLX08_009032 [Tetragonisca angustula]|uniref:Scavenger receptor class B member 1 n=1 Tax=Tetragonisca angustula TaxID=166442 RepID=A0AAW0ZHM6_9HYME
MKFTNPLPQFKKCIVLFLLSISCSVLSYLIYLVDPVKLVLNYKLQMVPDSMLFELWKKPPIDVYIKVYIFNITNAEEFLEGGVKLKVEEIGPYVYQEVLENENVTWHENGTISFVPMRKIVYIPEMSVGNPEDDWVDVPNIPMLGFFSTIHNAGFFVNYPLTSLTNMLQSKPILHLSVQEYLWGYEDPLIRLASGILPNYIDFGKFGLLDRMYDEGKNVVLMNIKKNKNMTEEEGRYLSIESYNGNQGLSYWGYREGEGAHIRPENTVCNRIKGSTEGELFPMYIDKHAVFRIYRKSLCRPIPIVFKEEVMLESGINGYLYTMPDNLLDPPDQNPDNACYCKNKDKCLKRGLSDLTPCYYRIPAAMSLPHFLNGDPSLVEEIDGIKPDPEKHSTRIVLQPTIGIPMKVNSKMQINLVMHPTSYNRRVKPFSDMVIPLFWSEMVINDVPDDLMILMRLALQIGPIGQTVIIWSLAIVGMVLFVLLVPAIFWIINQQQQQQETMQTENRRDSDDLRIPLNYGQYATIRILPAVRKIASKTDLFS